MTTREASDPILTCDEARELERGRFGGDEAKEWPAMERAGRAIAAAVCRDAAEIGGLPARGARVRVLAGKGHNAGDALIAARVLAGALAEVRVEVVFAFGERALRPLAARAWRELAACDGDGRGTRIVSMDTEAALAAADGGGRRDLCLDGVFGFQFRPPVEPRVRALLERAGTWDVRLRAAVDLPSAGIFLADFTYATGSVKTPVVGAAEAGRVRYLDLGFFAGGAAAATATGTAAGGEPGGSAAAGDAGRERRILRPRLLGPLAGFRAAQTDKRSFGHTVVLGGSRRYPGAVLLAVEAALRSGAGLVTALVPETLAPAFAARAPEAMWVGWPETPAGGLALEGERLGREALERATALTIGPGMGREPETLALAESLVARSPVPVTIDADALQPAIVRAGTARRILTPHAGEWARVREAVAGDARTTVVAKGPVTWIWTEGAAGPVYGSFFGGPVLARGGSGDVLAGLTGGLLAQMPDEPELAAARAAVWHGLAAEAMARARGQVAATAGELRGFLSEALREAAEDGR